MSGIEGRDWSCDLPQDILELILSYIRLMDDIKHFGAVCKQWHLAMTDYTKKHICFGTQWLAKKMYMDSVVTLHNPLANNYPCWTSIDFPLMCGASILCSKDGWLLMNKGYEVFFLSLFPKSVIKLPNLPDRGVNFTCFTISSAPTFKDWKICGLRQYQSSIYKRKFGIFTLCHGDKDWTRTLGTVPRGYFMAHETNPVYHKGKFYLLCGFGVLGVLDPVTRSWKLLAPENYGDFDNFKYMLEFQGELVAISILSMGYRAKVLKWDESKTIWDEVNDIGEYTFFLSGKTSYAKKSTKGYMRNKLFFPNLHENYGVFYCLENGSYKTFGNDFSSKNLINTSSILECCWMEPTQHDISTTTEWVEILSCDQCTPSFVLDDDDDSAEDDDDDIDYCTDKEDEECLNVLDKHLGL